MFRYFESLNFILNEGLAELCQKIRDARIEENKNGKTKKSVRPIISDIDLIYKFTQILSELQRAKKYHPLEQNEIDEYIGIVNQMLDHIFEGPHMSDKKNVITALCHRADTDPINFYFFNQKVLKDDHVRKAYAFRRGPIALCLDTNTESLFSSGQISLHVDEIFWNFLKKDEVKLSWIGDLLKSFKSNFSNCLWDKNSTYLEKNMSNFYYLRSDLINFRYNPSMLFFSEGVSKLIVLILVFGIIYKMREDDFPIYLVRWKNGLVLMTFSHLIHEYGEICSYATKMIDRIVPSPIQLYKYLLNLWNIIDFCAYTCLVIWACTYLKIVGISEIVGESAICVSTIFLAVAMLRYLSMNENMGKLTILLIRMTKFKLVHPIVIPIMIQFYQVMRCEHCRVSLKP